MKPLSNAVGKCRNLLEILSVMILMSVSVTASAATEFKTWTHDFVKDDFIKSTSDENEATKNLVWDGIEATITLKSSQLSKFGFVKSGVVYYVFAGERTASYMKSVQIKLTSPFAGKKINKITLTGKLEQQGQTTFSINCGVYKGTINLSGKTNEPLAGGTTTSLYEFDTKGLEGDEIRIDITASSVPSKSQGTIGLKSISVEYQEEEEPSGPKDAEDTIDSGSLSGTGEGNILENVLLKGTSGNEYIITGSLAGNRLCLYSGEGEAEGTGYIETASTPGAYYGDISITGLLWDNAAAGASAGACRLGIYGIIPRDNAAKCVNISYNATTEPETAGDEILLFTIPVRSAPSDFSGCIPGNYNMLIVRPISDSGDESCRISFEKISLNLMARPSGYISDVFDLENGALKTDSDGETRITGYMRVVAVSPGDGPSYAIDPRGDVIKLTKEKSAEDTEADSRGDSGEAMSSLYRDAAIHDLVFIPYYSGSTPEAGIIGYGIGEEYLPETPGIPTDENLDPVYTEIPLDQGTITRATLVSIKCGLIKHGEIATSSVTGDISDYYPYVMMEGGAIMPVFDAFGENASLRKALRKYIDYLSSQGGAVYPEFLFRGIIMPYADWRPVRTKAEGDASEPQYVILLTEAKNTDGTGLSGIDAALADEDPADRADVGAEYYDLNGCKVLRPEKGRIYILKAEGSTEGSAAASKGLKTNGRSRVIRY